MLRKIGREESGRNNLRKINIKLATELIRLFVIHLKSQILTLALNNIVFQPKLTKCIRLVPTIG